MPPPAHRPRPVRSVLRRATPALLGIAVIGLLGTVALRISVSNLDAAQVDRTKTRRDTTLVLARNGSDLIDPAAKAATVASSPFAPGAEGLNAMLLRQFQGSDKRGAAVALVGVDGRTLAAIPAGATVGTGELGVAWTAAVDGRPALTDAFRHDGEVVNAALLPVGGTAPWAVIVMVEPAATSSGQAFHEQVGSLNREPGGFVLVDRQGVAVNSWDPGELGHQVVRPEDLASFPRDDTRVWTEVRNGAEVTFQGTGMDHGYAFLFEQRTDALFGDLREVQQQRDTILLAVLGGALLALIGLGIARESVARRARSRVDALLRNSRDVVLVTGDDGTMAFVSPAAERLLGADPRAWRGRNLLDLCHPDDRASLRRLLDTPGSGPLLNVRLRGAGSGGEHGWFDIDARDLRDHAEVGGILLTCHEIGERKLLQDELLHQASHDRLTGLPNRAEFSRRLELMLEGGFPKRPFALLYVDLDHFKPLNDTLGHDAGDEVLVMLAARLRDTAGGEGFVARLGGDEFAVLVEGAGRVEAAAVAQQLVEAARAPIVVGANLANLDASIGIALAEPDVELYNAEHLVRQADQAMYEAKQAGRGRYAFAAETADLAPSDLDATVSPAAPAPGDEPVIVPGDDAQAASPVALAARRRRRGALVPLAVVGVLVVAVGALGFWQTADGQRAAELERVAHQMKMAAKSAEFYSGQMSATRLMKVAGNAPWGLNGSAIDATLVKAFATSPTAGEDAVAILSAPDGRRLAAYPETTTVSIPTDSPIWQQALAGNGNQLARLGGADLSRNAYVLPIVKDGRTAGVLTLSLSLVKGPAQKALEKGGYAGYQNGGWSVMDGQGVIYNSWNPALLGTRVADPGQLTGLELGQARDLSTPTTIVLATPMNSAIDPIYLVFSMPAADFYRELRIGLVQRNLAFLGIVAAAAAGLALANHRRERAVRRSEARLDALVQQAHDVVVVLSRDGETHYVSSAARGLLGYEPEQLTSRHLIDLVHPEDRPRIAALIAETESRGEGAVTDVRVARADSSDYRYFDISATDLRHHRDIQGLVLTCHEVGERRELQDQLVYRARHDALTGLPNRATLARRMAELAETEDAGPFAVLFADLDHFKPVNDTLGHDAGDEVLRIVAQRFSRSVRSDHGDGSGDLVCRLGGDEFAIILRNTTEAIARATADRLIAAATEPIRVGDHTVRIGVTIGISLSHPHRDDPDVAIRNADHAMYQAKAAGRGTYALFAGR